MKVLAFALPITRPALCSLMVHIHQYKLVYNTVVTMFVIFPVFLSKLF